MRRTPQDTHDTESAELREELAEVCGVLNVAHARLVALTAQAIDRDLWQGWGIRSVEHWLCWQTGLSPSRAKQVVATARRYDELPATMDTFAAGELSVDQVVTIAERIPAHNDAQVAAFAKCATVSQLRKVLCRQMFTFPESACAGQRDGDSDGDSPGCGESHGGGHNPGDRESHGDSERRGDSDSPSEADAPPADNAGPDPAGAPTPMVDPDAAHERINRAQAPPELSMGDDGSRFFLHFEGSTEIGALIRQALAEARDRLFDAGDPRASWADALVEVCRRSLGSASKARQDHYRVLVHLDKEGGWVNAGPALPPGLLKKLLCDGRVSPVWEAGGYPVNVGRSMRIVPAHTRRLVEDRDRECLFPGCHAAAFLEVHHLVHWSDGGPTDTWNLGCLCPFHHSSHHRGDFDITGNADHPETLQFTDREGREIRSFAVPTPPTGPLPEPPPGHSYVHPVGERIQARWLYFPPPPGPRTASQATTPRGSPIRGHPPAA